MDQNLSKLRNGILELSKVSNIEIVELIRIGKKAEAMRLIEISYYLEKTFNGIFSILYNKKKDLIDKHAKLLGEITGLKSILDPLLHQKLILALYVNNTVNTLSNNMKVIDCSFNFEQLVTVYVNWECFAKHFPEYINIQKIKGDDIYSDEGQKIVNDLFVAMKEKFSLS